MWISINLPEEMSILPHFEAIFLTEHLFDCTSHVWTAAVEEKAKIAIGALYPGFSIALLGQMTCKGVFTHGGIRAHLGFYNLEVHVASWWKDLFSKANRICLTAYSSVCNRPDIREVQGYRQHEVDSSSQGCGNTSSLCTRRHVPVSSYLMIFICLFYI